MTIPSASRDVRPLLCVRIACDHDLHPVRRQHLHAGEEGRNRKSMGVEAEKQRPIYPLLEAVLANGLGDGQDVPFVEGPVER
jgi:hypothetical protein